MFYYDMLQYNTRETVYIPSLQVSVAPAAGDAVQRRLYSIVGLHSAFSILHYAL